jgi:hypothetical protein
MRGIGDAQPRRAMAVVAGFPGPALEPDASLQGSAAAISALSILPVLTRTIDAA